MEAFQLQAFENRRWSTRDQEVVWRHYAALALVREEPVLDIAGGDGLFLSLLRQRRGFKDLTMVDVSPVAVEKAKRKELDARVLDVTQPLPFPDKSFGTACALDVLEHLYDPLPVLREMGRVSRWAVVVVPNFHYWKGRLQMMTGRIPFECKPERGHVHWFNYPILRRLVSEADLKIEAERFGSIQRLGVVGEWLAKLHPNLFAYSFAFLLRNNQI
jgi:methionine biosynthesis protein MetW